MEKNEMKTIMLALSVMPALLVSCNSHQPKKQEAARPNIIYILSDDLGYGDLGCYGQKEIRTPNIDQMAMEGMRFTAHYAGSTVCAPSRCTLMTGLHTGHCRIRNNERVPLRDSDITIAELLKETGYTTALIGKWGLGNPGTTGVPTKQGFDYFFGYMDQGHAHNYYPTFLWRNEEKVQLSNVVPDETEEGRGVATVRNEYSHDLFTKEAYEFVEKQKDAENPFFLYLAYTIPHANNEAWRKNDDAMEVPDFSDYADKDWPERQKKHAAMISRMDKDIGGLFAKLKELGMDENTIVFFSSDNGPHAEGVDYEFNNSNGIYRGFKRDMYEGGIRVPLIARWPGKIREATTTGYISAFWDMLPTFAELGKASKIPQTDGISLVPLLLNRGEQKKHDYLYWEFSSLGGKQAVRMGDWKGIKLNVQDDPEKPIELYNLKSDPSEERDVATQNPGIDSQITEIMKQAHTSSEAFPLFKKIKKEFN
jgi:arylsulfatase A-like enzyme